jgi:leucyl-tRNA synthetase
VVDPDTGARPTKLVDADPGDRALERSLHVTIKKVTEAMGSLRLNTAIADLMTFVNDATKAPQVPVAYVEAFVRLVAPFAPHLAEELWERLGHTGGITFAPWPVWDEAKTKADVITVVVQVNGKLRAQLGLLPGATEEDAVAAALADPGVQKFLVGGTIRKRIYVPGRLLNFVVG